MPPIKNLSFLQPGYWVFLRLVARAQHCILFRWEPPNRGQWQFLLPEDSAVLFPGSALAMNRQCAKLLQTYFQLLTFLRSFWSRKRTIPFPLCRMLNRRNQELLQPYQMCLRDGKAGP